MLCSRSRAHLIVTDVQDKLVPHVADPAPVLRNAARLLGIARRLDIPITLTEHYVAGLGPTLQPLREAAGMYAAIGEKQTFSALRTPWFDTRVRALRQEGRREIVIAGLEAHVCVLQTSSDLVAAGFDVFVVADAVSSRLPLARDLALARLRQDGCAVVTTEMVAFEWLEQGGKPEFRDLLPLIK